MQVKNSIQFLWEYLRGYSGVVIWSTALSIAQAIALLVPAIFIKRIFDESIPEKDLNQTWGLVALVTGLLLARGILQVLENRSTVRLSRKALTRIRQRLLSTLMSLDPPELVHTDKAKYHMTLINDTEKVGTMISTFITRIFPSATMGLFLLIALIVIDVQLTLVLAIFLPITYFISRFVKSDTQKIVRKYYSTLSEFSRQMMFLLDHSRLIKTKSADKIVQRSNQVHLSKLEEEGRCMGRAFATQRITLETLILMISLIMLAAGSYLVITEQLTIGSFLSYYFILFILRKEQLGIVNALPQFLQGSECLPRLKEFIEAKRKILYTGEQEVQFSEVIELKDVTFSHSDKRLLESVNLKIGIGEIVVIKGANGVGKTTLVDLILGFQKPQAGAISVDGVSYDDIKIDHLRSQIGVVWQDQSLFNGSIRQNILFGVVDPNDSDLNKALRLSTADDLSSENGAPLESQVGENGDSLSGGQKQKIAIARALIGNPQLLILDEPTTNLDTFSIERLIDNIRHLVPRPSVLIISHSDDFDLVADRKYHLKNGVLKSKHETKTKGVFA